MAETGNYLLAAAVLFFLMMAAAAYIVYRMLARTVRVAVRLVIAAVMFLIGTGGGSALWFWAKSDAARPGQTQQRKASSPK